MPQTGSIALPPKTVDFGLSPSPFEAISGIKESATRVKLNRCQFKRIQSMCSSLHQTKPLVRSVQRLLVAVHARCHTWCTSDLLPSLVLIPGDMDTYERQCINLRAPQSFDPSAEDKKVEEEAISSAVKKIITDEPTRSKAMALRDRPAEIFVTYLQEELDRDPDMETGLREEFIKALRKLAVESEKLPTSLNLEEVTLNDPFPVAWGGFSDIYQGKWRNKIVAVKRPRIFMSEDNAEAFKLARREILLWRQLSNEFILPLLGVFKESGLLDSMVSEWMHNGTLKTFLKQPENRQVDRLKLILQVLQAVCYLHNHKPQVAHGDINAKNIFMSSDNRPLLGDFGLSCIHYSKNRTLTSIMDAGTVRWMAPEILRQDRSIGRHGKPSPESDVWSIGMFMLEVFTDADPYNDEPDHIVITNILEKKILPARPSTHITERGLTNGVWDLMQQCWDYNASSRPSIEYLVRNLKRLSIEVHPSAWDRRTETELIPTCFVQRVITNDQAHWKALNVEMVKERGSIRKDEILMTLVSITGDAESVAEARRRISETVEKISELPDRLELKVPKMFHSRIIGKKRCHIARLERKYHVRISFPPKPSPSEIFAVEGPVIGISGAKHDLQKMIQFERSSRDVISVSRRAAEIIEERKQDLCRPPLHEMDVDNKKCTVTFRGSREGIIFGQASVRAIEAEVAKEVIKEIPVDKIIFNMINSDNKTWTDIVERCGHGNLKGKHGLIDLTPNKVRLQGPPELVADLSTELMQVSNIEHGCVTGKRIPSRWHEALMGPQNELVNDIRKHTGAMPYFPTSGGYAVLAMPENMHRYDNVPPEDVVKLVGPFDARKKAREYLEDLVKKTMDNTYSFNARLQHFIHKKVHARFRALGVSVKPDPPMMTAQSIVTFVSDDPDRITAKSPGGSQPTWTIHERYDKEVPLCKWILDAQSPEALTMAGDVIIKEVKAAFRRIGIINLSNPAQLRVFGMHLAEFQCQDEGLTFEVIEDPGQVVIAGHSTDAVELAINKFISLLESEEP